MNDQHKLDVTHRNVPAFTCLVYVREVDGKVSARVANLEGIEAIADSERNVLAIVIPEFKKRIAGYVGEEKEIPWVDPPGPPRDDEQKRLVPVHL